MSVVSKQSFARSTPLRCVAPSSVSVIRVVLAIVVLQLVERSPSNTELVAWIGIPVVFGLDAADGVLARWLKVPTLLGSFIDIAADRIVEFVFIRFFLNLGVLPWWFGMIFYGRILVTDACRVLAFFTQSVLPGGIVLPLPTRGLVLSKLSRTAYATLKAGFFGVLLLGKHNHDSSLSLFEIGLMVSVLTCSLFRATPILITYIPRWRDVTPAKLFSYARAEVDDVAPRFTKIVSGLQFASDVGLATWIFVIALR